MFEFVSLLLAALALAIAYVPILSNGFVLDDVFLVREAEGLGDPGALGSMLLNPFWKNSSYIADLLHDYWRPVTTFALWLTAFVAGKAPWAFHLLSILGLAGATAALYALLRRLCPRGDRRAAMWLALLFAAHPLAAEILGMVANVSDHLALSFLVLAVLAQLRHLENGRARHLAAAAAFTALACGSKEVGLVATLSPAAALLLASTTGTRIARREWLRVSRWAASLAPGVIYLVVRAWVAHRAGWTETAWPSAGSLSLALAVGPGLALKGIVAPSPSGANVYLTGAEIIPWLVAIGAWTLLAVAVLRPVAKRAPLDLPAIGAAFALALLLPSLLGVERLSEGGPLRFPTRYFHLPLAGLLVAALPVTRRLWDRVLRFAVPLAVALLALLSWMRVDEWQDEVSYFTAEAAYHPDSLYDQLNVVRALSQKRAFAATEKAIERARRFEGASAPEVRARLANDEATVLLLRDGDTAAAIRLLEEANAIWPHDLANVLDLSSIYMVAGERDRAIAVLERALAAPYFRDYRRAALEERLEKYRGR